jgi:hypothetical protein
VEVLLFFFLCELFDLPISGFATNKAGKIYFFTLRAQAKHLPGTFIRRILLLSRSPVSGQQAGQLPPAQVHQQRGGPGQS